MHVHACANKCQCVCVREFVLVNVCEESVCAYECMCNRNLPTLPTTQLCVIKNRQTAEQKKPPKQIKLLKDI